MNPIREAMSRLPGHWHKGSRADGQGNFCGLGHVDEVCDEFYSELPQNAPSFASWRIMSKVAIEQYPERIVEGQMEPFAEFNDHPDTTEDEVMAVMDKAAVQWDELYG